MGAHNEAAQKCDIHTYIPALYNNTFSEIALTLPLKGKWEEQDGRAGRKSNPCNLRRSIRFYNINQLSSLNLTWG